MEHWLTDSAQAFISDIPSQKHSSLINFVASCFNFYVIWTFNLGKKVLVTIATYSDYDLMFQSCLIHIDFEDVPHFDSFILLKAFLCNVLLVFRLATLAFMFPAICLVLGLIWFFIFKSSVPLFCRALCFYFHLVNFECCAYLVVDNNLVNSYPKMLLLFFSLNLSLIPVLNHISRFISRFRFVFCSWF